MATPEKPPSPGRERRPDVAINVDEHQSDQRGEHRYPEESQTDGERRARDEREYLRRRLERRP